MRYYSVTGRGDRCDHACELNANVPSPSIIYMWLVRLVKRCVGFNIKQQQHEVGYCSFSFTRISNVLFKYKRKKDVTLVAKAESTF